MIGQIKFVIYIVYLLYRVLAIAFGHETCLFLGKQIFCPVILCVVAP